MSKLIINIPDNIEIDDVKYRIENELLLRFGDKIEVSYE